MGGWAEPPLAIAEGVSRRLQRGYVMRFSRILAVVLTAGPDNDPSPDSWPVDFNDDQVVTGSDILKLGSVFGSNELATPPPPYNARMDFNDDGLITGSDVLKFGRYFGKRCT